MLPSDTFHVRAGSSRAPSPAVAPFAAIMLLCLVLTSCGGDYCIEGIFNPGGTITGNTGGCALNKAMGTVSVSITSAAASTDGPTAPNLLHIYVTLEGIEAHPNAIAPGDSPDWEELAPDLASEPKQIDLLAHPANSCAANPVQRTVVSAGGYRQIRLRLLPNRPPAGNAVPAQNICGELGFHCAVSPDGHSHRLTFDGDATFLRVAPDRTSGGLFSVLPDTTTQLAIEFNPFSSFVRSAGDAIQITPAFAIEPAASCAIQAASQP
jgi:uncharacterized protein DUF4382